MKRLPLTAGLVAGGLGWALVVPQAGAQSSSTSGSQQGQEQIQSAQTQSQQGLEQAQKAQKQATDAEKQAEQAEKEVTQQQQKLSQAEQKAQSKRAEAQKAQANAQAQAKNAQSAVSQGQQEALQGQQQAEKKLKASNMPATQQSVSGQLTRISGNQLTIERPGATPLKLQVNPQTQATLDGKQVGIQQLPQGAQVHASYKLQNDQPTAVRIEATQSSSGQSSSSSY